MMWYMEYIICVLQRLFVDERLFRSTGLYFNEWFATFYFKIGKLPLTRPYKVAAGILGLTALDDFTVDWLKKTALNIWWQDRPK